MDIQFEGTMSFQVFFATVLLLFLLLCYYSNRLPGFPWKVRAAHKDEQVDFARGMLRLHLDKCFRLS